MELAVISGLGKYWFSIDQAFLYSVTLSLSSILGTKEISKNLDR